MSKTIEFLFDFGSPNAYLSYPLIKGIAERHGASLEITPILLGGLFKITGNQAPMVAFGRIPNKIAYEMLEMKRFIEKHGLSKFKMNPFFPVHTVLIMRGLIAAKEAGVDESYINAVLTAIWEDEKNMSEEAVVREVLESAGLDANRLLIEAVSNPVKEKLKSNTQVAANRGAFGIPTFFIGSEMFFGKERLAQVEEALG
ncbi:MAG: 2-hydroxychromene-2-carboxylate isomerase [Marinicaulis sp.]|nr:2-hydroxychromene-2-carboxylate isomerase [Marinicaulis sp.]